jgi:phage baseplate assembly protein W
LQRVLFTAPGERVNRPTFGSGLLRSVFASNAATRRSAPVKVLAEHDEPKRADSIVILKPPAHL